MEEEFKKLIKRLIKEKFSKEKIDVLNCIKGMTMTTSTISDELKQSLPLTSYHLYKLMSYGIITKIFENEERQTDQYFKLTQLGLMVLEVST